MVLFDDRREAGRRLAAVLAARLTGTNTVVLGLPRGGVPVAAQVARALRTPLDVIVVRKLDVPWQAEPNMGAVGEDGVAFVDTDAVRLWQVTPEQLGRVQARAVSAALRRAYRLRGHRSAVPLTGRMVIIVDEAIVTGATARAACRVARMRGAARVIFAVPVAPLGAERRLAGDADEVICLHQLSEFGTVGGFYADFDPVSDDEVTSLLAEATEPVDVHPR